MRSAMRGMAVMVLLMILLAPGAVQARTLGWSWDRVSMTSPEIFLKKVWNLLAFWRENSGSSALSKNGCGLDPAGQPVCDGGSGSGTTGGTSGSGDNGCGLDPAGSPCNP